MKINTVYTAIAVAISALIAYSFYIFFDGDNRLLLTLGSFILLFISMFMTIALKFKDVTRTTSLVRVVSGIMFGIFLTANIIFSFTAFNKDWYIIIFGLLLLIYVLIIYSIAKARQ